jgi:hypothetical protein
MNSVADKFAPATAMPLSAAGKTSGSDASASALTAPLARALLGRTDTLFLRVHDFHARPADYIHPSHLAALVPENALSVITATVRGRNALSHWILQNLGMQGQPWISFEQPATRLALLPASLLRRAAVLAGASVCAPQIARIISRDELNDLKEKIGGEDARTFALKTAPILLGAPPAIGPVNASDDTVAAQVVATGWRMLELAFSGEPLMLTQRLRLKFDAALPLEFAPVPLAEKAKAGSYLTRIVTRELSPDWAPCFV